MSIIIVLLVFFPLVSCFCLCLHKRPVKSSFSKLFFIPPIRNYRVIPCEIKTTAELGSQIFFIFCTNYCFLIHWNIKKLKFELHTPHFLRYQHLGSELCSIWLPFDCFLIFLDPIISGNNKSWGLRCIDISTKSLHQCLMGLLNLQRPCKTQYHFMYKAVTTSFEGKKHIAKIIVAFQFFFFSNFS